MRQVLVRDDRSVLPQLNFLDRHGGDLGDEDSAERVGQRRFSTDQVKNDLLFIKLLNSDVRVFDEGSQAGLIETIGLCGQTCRVLKCCNVFD